MQIGLLGLLDVRENGISITPTAPKPRQALALLALHADQVVPVSALIDELWAGRPPRSARTTLQTYVLQLRDLIGIALEKESAAAGPAEGRPRSAKDVLVTSPGGYMLVSGDGPNDVREFERLAGMGYRALDTGDFQGASRLLREALALWTGLAFAGVQTGTLLETEARRLEESRLCALDQRIEADLRLGRHRELLAELTVLTSRYRTHENLHAQFMLALHRSGRRGEALDVYQRLRGTLIRGLGLEPSERLRRLQRSILITAQETAPQSEQRLAAAVSPARVCGTAR
ncbi:AfsR/SARP family transcriptional regulator [Streptomyces canus]|uniref:AfsR/SARP family transcriptional regulator n=1 Tax=Streptomyces canus TaxID=58343 RepID=UPI0027881143|nr:AfsR/SARP family transcriptional regulator [Streptomyces canus]MDQ0757413.1 DNA-binding SARP family transcriptional activator [Streptomyces canus]MDQ1064654.1 DNA-binding SARP family transcriptional activator [Streptomyces canus]